MDEELKKHIQSLPINDVEKEYLIKEFKAHQKNIDVFEFKFKRTLVDKTAITNILNASITEIEKQKKTIEEAKNEINQTFLELNKQKEIIEEKNKALNQALLNLQDTQRQLIQSEKMASLGELTAGIAHEIQNPLNFVNNFSEVNTELIAEMKEEIRNGNMDAVNALATDMAENEQKIVYHGKRADAIVKNMLLHSRSSKGEKQPTDINALADEYLRLSYHGLRAKNKSLNTKIETHFDDSIGKIIIVSQDIGRVLLNLFTNAFYAVNEKKKQVGEAYEPVVAVRTKKENGKIEIRVSDNGMGISKSSIEKIFQPFFTTKPAGEGTGLGLSLSYDIIKAHGGIMTVESEPDVFTTFCIELPIKGTGTEK